MQKYRSIFITRTRLITILNHKAFESIIKGCFVAFKSLSEESGELEYHVGQVVEVMTKEKQYSVSPSIKTSKVIKVKESPSYFMVISFDQLSNRFPSK